MKYPGIIYKEDNGYWIDFPDLEGTHTEGDTIEELMGNVDEALYLYLEYADKDNLPAPSELTGDNIIYVDILEAHRKVSELELQEWIKLRENGWTFQRIANKYHVSKQYVCNRLDKAGIKRKTKWSWAYEKWEELYKSGVSITKISEEFNCHKSTIHDHLKKKFVIEQSEVRKKGWVTRREVKPLIPTINTEQLNYLTILMTKFKEQKKEFAHT